MIRICPSCGRKNRVPGRHLHEVGNCGACKAPLPALGAPLEVDEAEFDSVVKEAAVPVLVDFWAAWCGPCRLAAPEVEKTAGEMAGRAVVLKVDTERAPRLAARFNIRGIPNFVVLRDGRLISQQAGLVDHRVMKGWLEQASRQA